MLTFEPEMKEENHYLYNHRVNRNERQQSDEKLLANGVKIKEAYHQERYKSSTTPEALAIVKEAKQELEVSKPAPTPASQRSYTPSI